MDKVLSAQVIAAIVIVLFLALAAVWIFIRKQRLCSLASHSLTPANNQWR